MTNTSAFDKKRPKIISLACHKLLACLLSSRCQSRPLSYISLHCEIFSYFVFPCKSFHCCSGSLLKRSVRQSVTECRKHNANTKSFPKYYIIDNRRKEMSTKVWYSMLGHLAKRQLSSFIWFCALALTRIRFSLQYRKEIW